MLAAVSVVRQVARAAGTDPLPPGSEAEREAARRLVEWLRARGDDAVVTPRRAALSVWGWGAAAAAVGSLASVASGWAGAAVAALGLAVIAAWSVPGRRETRDIAVAPGADIVVVARYGSEREPSPVRREWLAACAAVVIAAAAARARGVDGLALGAAQLVPTLALLAAAGAALDRALAGWPAPGEAAAIAVAVHDELAARPPRTLSPGLLLHGRGLPRLRHAVVLEILPRGSGARASHPQLRAAAERAGEALAIEPTALPRPGRLTVRVGGADAERAIDVALAVVDALDASLT
jgi:hypothetical protein